MTTVPVVTWAAAAGRLRRNRWAGVRTAAFMRSEETWARGHRLVMPYAVACAVLSWGIAAGALLLAESGRVELAQLALGSVVLPALVALLGSEVVTRRLERENGE